MDLEQFSELAQTRRAMRRFKTDAIPEGLLEKLLNAARWAPSGYNLQPTHFVVVNDPRIKEKLCSACFSQPQVKTAPATVVFVGDPQVVRNNLDRMIAMEQECGATNDEYAGVLRKYVRLAFDTGPAGIGWLLKATLAPLMSVVKVVPSLPAVHRRFWLTKQVMLAAMNFMLAATAAGLDTIPMEGFDEAKVKSLLRIPRSHCVPVVIPVGYGDMADLKKSRLPLDGMVHENKWAPSF